MLWLLASCFCGTPNSGSRCVSDSFACCWDSFYLSGLPCPDWISGLFPCFTASCFVLFACCLLKAWTFLKTIWGEWIRRRSDVSGGGGVWEEEWEGRLWWRCMREEFIWNKQRKEILHWQIKKTFVGMSNLKRSLISGFRLFHMIFTFTLNIT